MTETTAKAKEKVESFPLTHNKVFPIKELFEAKVYKLPNQSVIAVEKASTHQERSALL